MSGGGWDIAKDIVNPVAALNDARTNQGLSKSFAGSGTVGQILNPAAYAFANRREGIGTFGAGGPVNSALDPLDIFGGQAKGEAQVAQQADSAVRNAPLPPLGPPGMGSPGLGQPAFGGGSYQPRPILAPHLLNQGQQRSGNMPYLRDRAFGQVLAPLQKQNWGVPQVNPAYLTGINQVQGGRIPQGQIQQAIDEQILPPPTETLLPGSPNVNYQPVPQDRRMWM